MSGTAAVGAAASRRIPRAAILGCLSLLLVGWSNLLIPALIRSIETDFEQTDAGLGVLFLITAISYAVASFGGGLLTERVGRRIVLVISTLLLAGGLVALSTTTSWTVVLAISVPMGMGSGAIDAGSNGLFLDLFPTSRGRALNVLHLFFGLGAFASPLVAGQLVSAGAAWQGVVGASAVAVLVLGALYAVTPMPSGRHVRAAGDIGDVSGDLPAGRSPDDRTVIHRRASSRIAWPLIGLAVAIGCYVAAEVGVSNWLVRFLDRASVSMATAALSLFWAALAAGRLVSARWSDRFDHARFAAVASIMSAAALVAAIVAPSLETSMLLFGAVGFAFGPIYPLIIAVGGDRYPARATAVSGALAGSATVGSILYPPVMGLLSVEVGLGVAMTGAAGLALLCGVVLVLVARMARDPHAVGRVDAVGAAG